VRRERRNQRQLDFLGATVKRAALDVLVIFGDDQHETLLSDTMPGFMVFTGARRDTGRRPRPGRVGSLPRRLSPA